MAGPPCVWAPRYILRHSGRPGGGASLAAEVPGTCYRSKKSTNIMPNQVPNQCRTSAELLPKCRTTAEPICSRISHARRAQIGI